MSRRDQNSPNVTRPALDRNILVGPSSQLPFQLRIDGTDDGTPERPETASTVAVPDELMSRRLPQNELDLLKEKLLTMASYAEAAVNRAVKALMRRDDEMARQTHAEDDMIDQLEVEIDGTAMALLEKRPEPFQLRFIAVAMKISNNLERVGDEATTISRRVIELAQEPQIAQATEVPALAGVVLAMLKESLDAFVTGRVDQAAGVVWRYRDANNYYIVRANALEGNVVLYKVENGKRADLPLKGSGRSYGKKAPVPKNTWSQLGVTVRGPLFTVSINGQGLYEVEDTTFTTAGKVGLWTKADSVTYFDDFTIVPR